MGRVAESSTTGRMLRPSRTFRDRVAGAGGLAGSWVASTAIFVGLGVAWRVARYAAGPPLWGDEAFLAVSIIVRDFAGLLGPLEYHQIAPVGFLWAERLAFLGLGASEWSLRLVPFLAGLASLALFAGLAPRVVDRRSAILAVGIFAASFYPVRHATEVKPYATDLLLSLVTTILAWSVWLDRDSARRWLALTVTVGFGVWFSYPLVFVAAGVGGLLAFRVLREARPRPLAGFVGFGLVASASWLASYVLVATPQAREAPFYASLKTWEGAFPPWSEPWRLPSWLVDVHSGNMLAYPNGGNNFGSLATAILVAVGCWRLKRSRPALLALLLAPLVPTFLASSFRLYPYGTSARTTLYMAPAFCLLAGVGLATVVRKLAGPRRRRAFRLAGLALVAMMAVGTVVNVGWPYKNYEDGENRRAVAELAGLARPGDRWIFFDGLRELPTSRGLMLEHWLQQMAEVRYNVLARAPVPVEFDEGWERDHPPATGKTWLIVHRSGCPGFDRAGLDRLRAALEARLGPPRAQVDRLTRGESVESFEYPTPAR